MCGICGVYGTSEANKTRRMLDSILHRGPDGNTVHNFPWGSLGFCRLDIFGPPGVNQPAIFANKTAVVFNGEIYNFDELNALLPDGEEVSDEASLILKLFLKDGVECFKKIKGMFAIAVMTPDGLILARDAVGIKPLVYSVINRKVYFASEIKALLRVKDDVVEIDEDALAEASVFGFIFDLNKTMFKGITQVQPGSYIRFKDGQVTLTKFCELKSSFYCSEAWDNAKTVATFSSIMNASAKDYLKHSKHSQAIYLSGGLDSTLMTSFLQSNSQELLDTYTLYDDEMHEDRIFAAKVAGELGTNHYEYKTGQDECLSFLDHYLYHFESLVTDGIFNVLGSLAFHLLSRKISMKHKVAYCGEGADELFGGYYWMHSHPLGFGDRLRERSRKVYGGNTKINEYIMQKFPDDDSKEADMRKEIFDILMGPGLTNCHLWSVDRSSSAFSFEARPLYLNDDLRNWALSLPIENKLSKDRNTKLILKKFALDTGNPLIYEVSARKKIGLPAALETSFKQLISYSEEEFKKRKNNRNLPHHQYSSFLNTDLEKLMFDKFYELFIINRGNLKMEVSYGNNKSRYGN